MSVSSETGKSTWRDSSSLFPGEKALPQGCQVSYKRMRSSRERTDHERFQVMGVRPENADIAFPPIPCSRLQASLLEPAIVTVSSASPSLFWCTPICLSRKHDSRPYLCYMSAVQPYIQDCSQKAQKMQESHTPPLTQPRMVSAALHWAAHNTGVPARQCSFTSPIPHVLQYLHLTSPHFTSTPHDYV